VLRLDKTVKMSGLAKLQSNYVDLAIGRIESAPLGPDITLVPRVGAGQGRISIPKGDFFIDSDPAIGKLAVDHNQVYVSEDVARAVVADLDAVSPGFMNSAYYIKDGLIFPTILSDTTVPHLLAAVRQKRQEDIEGLKATADLAEALAWWYVGARFPVKVKTPAPTAAKDVAKGAAQGGSAAKAAFDAARIADELFTATKALVNPGQKMVTAARQLSVMGGLTAAQKVQVMLDFFKRIGFAISKTGVVDETARFVMYSEDSRYAFAFMKDTAEILYGKINMQTFGYVWEVLK
jgi:hypothetical protein